MALISFPSNLNINKQTACNTHVTLWQKPLLAGSFSFLEQAATFILQYTQYTVAL